MIKMARMAEPDELNWIQNSLAGDTEAFAALVTQHQKMVHAMAFRMTGSLADAEDLTQETFLRAFRQLGSFRAESKFSTWLCQIAMNLSLNWRARENRRGEIHSQWAKDAICENNVRGGFPDELSSRVQTALDKLPAKQRAAIVLTIYEGRNHAETAKILNCTEATISWRVFAARQKLKKLLKGISHEQP
jgi:RNA polymerase sigma-70 factor (ECF subfamily)